MFAYLTIALGSFLTAGLTLFSGFGLSTLLMPVFALFFPGEVAVAATAMVHAANNLFKILVVGRYADKSLVLRFGIPAIIAAMVGAGLLQYVAYFPEIFSYSIGSRVAVITPLKLLLAVMIFGFALFELLPRFRRLQIKQKYLWLGGVASGFFGGLSGHQGALRSAFLAKTKISTQAFVGTNAVLGFMVDLVRMSVYALGFALLPGATGIKNEQWPLILTAILAAFAGVLLAKRYLHQIKLSAVQNLTGILLLVIALVLGMGLV